MFLLHVKFNLTLCTHDFEKMGFPGKKCPSATPFFLVLSPGGHEEKRPDDTT